LQKRLGGKLYKNVLLAYALSYCKILDRVVKGLPGNSPAYLKNLTLSRMTLSKMMFRKMAFSRLNSAE
jgi:hypothetical protein